MNSKILEYNLERYNKQKHLLDKLEQITKPLKEIGIVHFAYNELCFDGSYNILCCNISWVEYFFKKINQLEPGLLFDNMIFDKNGISKVVWDLQQKSDMVKELAQYNIVDGYSLFIKKPSAQKIVSFHFGSVGRNKDVYRYYLNGEDEFKNFVKYFYAEMGLEALKTMSTYTSIGLKKLLQQYLKDNQLSLRLEIKKYEIEYNSQKQTISKREFACLKLLAQAKTAKDIGQILGISPRTVETYLLNLKHKYNLHSKDDLLALYQQIL